jgi:hypothetical protein
MNAHVSGEQRVWLADYHEAALEVKIFKERMPMC